jgi:hypothetical protein
MNNWRASAATLRVLQSSGGQHSHSNPVFNDFAYVLENLTRNIYEQVTLLVLFRGSALFSPWAWTG